METLTEHEKAVWREIVAECGYPYPLNATKSVNVGSLKRRQIILKIAKILRDY